MSRYDFTEASAFLEMEAGITPGELYDEVLLAMHGLEKIENKRNMATVNKIWCTLMTVADFLERID